MNSANNSCDPPPPAAVRNHPGINSWRMEEKYLFGFPDECFPKSSMYTKHNVFLFTI